MKTNNTWLGSNELVIITAGDTAYVRERHEDWSIVFSGSYEGCQKYCEERYLDYCESIIG